MPSLSNIGKKANTKAKAEFADQLSSYTRLTSDEIKTLFPTKADRDELVELIQIIHSDANDKAKQAQLAANIGKVGGAIIKLAKTVIV